MGFFETRITEDPQLFQKKTWQKKGSTQEERDLRGFIYETFSNYINAFDWNKDKVVRILFFGSVFVNSLTLVVRFRLCLQFKSFHQKRKHVMLLTQGFKLLILPRTCLHLSLGRVLLAREILT